MSAYPCGVLVDRKLQDEVEFVREACAVEHTHAPELAAEKGRQGVERRGPTYEDHVGSLPLAHEGTIRFLTATNVGKAPPPLSARRWRHGFAGVCDTRHRFDFQAAFGHCQREGGGLLDIDMPFELKPSLQQSLQHRSAHRLGAGCLAVGGHRLNRVVFGSDPAWPTSHAVPV